MSTISNTASHSSRNEGLDLIRAVAITTVLFAHATAIIWGPRRTITLISGPLAVLGVEIFFVLSGYLIGGILLRIIEKRGRLDPQDIVSFWKRRWWRTLPNYLLFLLIYICLAHPPLFHIPREFGRFFVFCQNLTPRHPNYDVFPVSWSLAIEEWEYILLPICTALAVSIFVPRGVRVSRAILMAISLMIAVPLLLKCVTGSGLPWDAYFRKVVCYRLDSIGYGVLLAWISMYNPTLFSKLKTSASLYVTVGVIVTALVVTQLALVSSGSAGAFNTRRYLTVTKLCRVK